MDKYTTVAAFFSGCAVTGILFKSYFHSTGKRIALNPPPLPSFAQKLATDPNLQHLILREWEDEDYRRQQGWVGNDLCHSKWSNAVRVLNYYWNKETNELTGVVWFGPNCESHRGLCHGGSYTSAFDDFTGHIAFCLGQPWYGATVQVNVALKKPIKIGSILRMHGKVIQNKKKLNITAVLDDGEGTKIYASLEGLSITGLRITAKEEHQTDAVSNRTWCNDVDENGRGRRYDSSWKKEEEVEDDRITKIVYKKVSTMTRWIGYGVVVGGVVGSVVYLWRR